MKVEIYIDNLRDYLANIVWNSDNDELCELAKQISSLIADVEINDEDMAVVEVPDNLEYDLKDLEVEFGCDVEEVKDD